MRKYDRPSMGWVSCGLLIKILPKQTTILIHQLHLAIQARSVCYMAEPTNQPKRYPCHSRPP